MKNFLENKISYNYVTTRRVSLGLDNGYSTVKTSEDKIIPSALITDDSSLNDITGEKGLVNGIEYIVDVTGQHVTDIDKTEKEDDRIITLATSAISIAKSFSGEEYKDVDCLELVLGVGLPVKYYGAQKANFEKLINQLDGVVVQYKNQKPKVLKIIKTYVLPQSAAVALNHKKEFEEAQESIVLDLGWDTLDVAAFDKIKLKTGKHATYKLGVSTLYSSLAQTISTEYKLEKNRYQIEQILKDGYVIVKGDKKPIDFLEPIIQQHLNKIYEAVNADFNSELNGAGAVFLIGGGFEAFGNRFRNMDIGNVVLLDNAQFANAKAFKEIALMKCKKDGLLK